MTDIPWQVKRRIRQLHREIGKLERWKLRIILWIGVVAIVMLLGCVIHYQVTY